MVRYIALVIFAISVASFEIVARNVAEVEMVLCNSRELLHVAMPMMRAISKCYTRYYTLSDKTFSNRGEKTAS